MKKKLAIKGHPTRGKEVIELLEMMGGTNMFSNDGVVIGHKKTNCYYVSENSTTKCISWDYIGPEEIDKYKIFTLEEFLEKYPFKVGDLVMDNVGLIGLIRNIKWVENEQEIYYVVAFNNKYDTSLYTVNNLKKIGAQLKPKVQFKTDTELYLLPDGYQFVDENGNVINTTKIGLKKKLPEYPKTYTECCKVLKKNPDIKPEIRMVSTEESLLFSKLIILKRCRDAYWKIAGEQMGLDKPWEPDWKDETQIKYMIITFNNELEFFSSIHSYVVGRRNHILSFPTEEMRDAFYENFKDLIENCKELL